mmetsp:Transcript_23044/g.66499  ORF Transcript_23044/g.66499 Transcript_23044/m.66499 type:complete len:292 (+) Transcript_23044:1624-2499(+)
MQNAMVPGKSFDGKRGNRLEQCGFSYTIFADQTIPPSMSKLDVTIVQEGPTGVQRQRNILAVDVLLIATAVVVRQHHIGHRRAVARIPGLGLLYGPDLGLILLPSLLQFLLRLALLLGGLLAAMRILLLVGVGRDAAVGPPKIPVGIGLVLGPFVEGGRHGHQSLPQLSDRGGVVIAVGIARCTSAICCDRIACLAIAVVATTAAAQLGRRQLVDRADGPADHIFVAAAALQEGPEQFVRRTLVARLGQLLQRVLGRINQSGKVRDQVFVKIRRRREKDRRQCRAQLLLGQ